MSYIKVKKEPHICLSIHYSLHYLYTVLMASTARLHADNGGGGQKICTVMNGCPIPNQFGVNGGPTLQLLVGHLIFLIVFNKNGTCENFKVQKNAKKFNALPIFPSCHTSKNTNRILSHQDVLALCGKISRNLFQDRRTRYQKINKKYY